MRYSGLIALGLGQLALAQDTPTPSPSASQTDTVTGTGSGTATGTASGTATGTGTGTGTASPSSSATDAARIPGEIGEFEYYGCFTSNSGFPGFTEAANDENMDLSICALSCPTRFFAVYDESCYCSEEVDEDSSQKVGDDVCDTVCPGNPTQFCGGEITSLRFARRQDVALNVALTVYIRVEDGESSIIPTASVTETATVTDVVTSCAPSDTDCTVGTATSTLTTTAVALPTININLFAIICFGDFCVPRFPCPECEPRRVVCREDKCLPEICPKGEEHNAHRLVICKGDECEFSHCGDDCQKKIVCHGEDCIRQKCIGDECNKKVVRHGDKFEFEECVDDCFIEEVCEGDECAPAPAPPAGVAPAPPTGKPAPPAARPAPPAGGAAPPAGGENEAPVAPPAGGAAPPAGGENQAPVASPAPECEGAECPPTAGSEKQLPALGMGVIAGLAFLL